MTDRSKLSDSSVICDYLEHQYPTPGVYPKVPSERARALWLEEYADTRLRDVLLNGLLRERVANPIVRGIPTDEERVARILEEELPPELEYLERCVPAEGFLMGDEPTIADFAIANCVPEREISRLPGRCDSMAPALRPT